jgi:predicted lipoprotein with Yx(FWY)xxD motif
MKTKIGIAVLGLVALALAAGNSGKQMTVKGYVIDSACAYTKSLDKPVSEECAKKCAAAGSPLVILAEDGTVYWPIDSETPAKGQNHKLIDAAGKRVKVTGMVYDRGGSKAIVIRQVSSAGK